MSGRKLLVGTRKGLFVFEREGNGWIQKRAEFLGVQVPMVLADQRSGLWHAAVEHGHFGTKMHRSADQGQTWEEMDPPAFPERPEDVPEVVEPMGNKPVPWSLEKVWALEGGGTDREGLLWCGTIPGGLFRSEDNGDSWELVRALWDLPDRAKWFGGGYDYPGIHSICVHPKDSNRVTLGISCGGVWVTEDGGSEWEQCAHGMVYDFLPEDQGGTAPDSQDPHSMVQCMSSPEHFWVQHHCGIYRSTDGARSWHEITGVEPSGFGFAVAVHPKDPETAWVVPAKKDEFRYPVDGKFLVNRTRDGGKTFEPLTNGLPDPPAYDLVYRHALAIDDSGETLAMGSTTGGLWITENQGDQWSLISAHLPPVYCVRIV